MSKREKVTVEERIYAAKVCAEGKLSYSEAARRLGVAEKSVREWIARYIARGPLAFAKQEHNSIYPEFIKRMAVEEYLAGNGSLIQVSAKYGLRSSAQLRNWIKVYNSGRDFKQKMSGGSHMKQGLKPHRKKELPLPENVSKTATTMVKLHLNTT